MDMQRRQPGEARVSPTDFLLLAYHSLRALGRELSACLALILLVACSGKDSEPAERDATVGTVDAAAQDAGSDALVIWLSADAATVDTTPEGPLSAKLQINGQNASCGSCAVLFLQVQGGKPPYEYTWSDPNLSGPGPHTVCPGEPTTYKATVTDSSQGGDDVEFVEPKMSAEATGDYRCQDGDVWGGCLPPESSDAGPVVETCAVAEVRDPLLNTLLFEFPYSFSNALPAGDKALVPGKRYEFNWDQLLLTLNLGKAVKVTLSGADQPCGATQKFGTWTLDGTPHQSFCFTPERAWQHIRVDIDIGDTFFYFEFEPGYTTTCLGCSSDPI